MWWAVLKKKASGIEGTPGYWVVNKEQNSLFVNCGGQTIGGSLTWRLPFEFILKMAHVAHDFPGITSQILGDSAYVNIAPTSKSNRIKIKRSSKNIKHRVQSAWNCAPT